MSHHQEDHEERAQEESAPAPVTPATRGRRFFKLAGMTAAVVGNYARSRLESAFSSPEEAARRRATAHTATGELIARTLGELKGAVMKVGQMASIASGVLPPELTGALASLRREAPPVPYEVIAAQIESELGAPPERLFARFERRPFAAASIGQVHRATTDDGREVVVKVQYPGVDASCDADLGQLKLALRASGLIPGRKKAVDELFEELRARLHEELDYCNEADNLRRFREYHARHPFLVLPTSVGERSSQRVLTLTFEPGDSLEQAEALYPQEQKDQIGEHLFQMLVSELFELGALHADPNPANFAFRPDGTVVVYDFGCVKLLPPEVVTAYRDVVRSGLAGDYPAVEDGLRRLGALRPDVPPLEESFYRDWRDTLLPPLLPGRPFDFRSSKIHEEVVRRIPGVFRHLSSFQPPKDLVLIDRVIVGQYWNLRLLGARACLRTLLDPYL